VKIGNLVPIILNCILLFVTLITISLLPTKIKLEDSIYKLIKANYDSNTLLNFN